MRAFVACVLSASLLLVSTPSMASEKAGVRPGFEESQIANEKIVLFRPAVKVGEKSMAGIFEPRAEWTDEARKLMDAELIRAQSRLSNELTPLGDMVGDDAEMVAEYEALFASVANSIMFHQFFVGNRLPTQKKGDFDWTLGGETKRLAEMTGANYGLFIYTEDHYSSGGNKAMRIIFGVGAPPLHIGYAGLVDLNTGHVLWLNADAQMGGDVRNAEGMEKRVRQLLEDFPGSVAEEG
ncbi:hypothetical protein KCG46_06550 [Erythrobacter sp. WH158]|uniref:DUF4136 domain-containing protein n=2 Tax=Erythrobacter crassostreae TaxID=2828328 RepID=A0A9X1F2S2_9SPHN|nr:hypothetical protein [Erythrobacter crassostrea]